MHKTASVFSSLKPARAKRKLQESAEGWRDCGLTSTNRRVSIRIRGIYRRPVLHESPDELCAATACCSMQRRRAARVACSSQFRVSGEHRKRLFNRLGPCAGVDEALNLCGVEIHFRLLRRSS